MTVAVDPSGWYMMNYFPTNGNYSTMWSNWSNLAGAVQNDLQNIRNPGFTPGWNWVRVCLGAVNGAFNFPYYQNGQLINGPSNTQKANLGTFCQFAYDAGLHVNFTMFDHYGRYDGGTTVNGWGQYGAAQFWLQQVNEAIQQSKSLTEADYTIDLKNEICFGDTTPYNGQYDIKWPYTINPTASNGDVALQWAESMVVYQRSLNATSPITISTFAGTASTSGPLGISVSRLTGSSALDYYTWHAYPPPQGNYGALLSNIQGAQAVLTTLGATQPLFIGETGNPTQYNNPQTNGSESTQYDWMQAARFACNSCGLPEPAPWMWIDPSPPSSATNYGFFNYNGTVKPVMKCYNSGLGGWALGSQNVPNPPS